MKTLRMVLGCLLVPLWAAAAHAETSELRLYALDCGHAEIDDGAALSDTGEWDGKKLPLADPCFLIQHPQGYLLWDAGLAPDIKSAPGVHVVPGPPLEGQLAKLGVKVSDVKYVAFSHLHYDHVGNANLFAGATWILDRREVAWAEHEPAHVSMQPQLFDAYRSARTIWIESDHDVFGDGRVRILQTPGHTPGSAVLWVGLHEHGPVLLSGDLYLQRESRQQGFVPTVNADRGATLASIARVERLAKNRGAQIVIQHDPRDAAGLPRLPSYWR